MEGCVSLKFPQKNGLNRQKQNTGKIEDFFKSKFTRLNNLVSTNTVNEFPVNCIYLSMIYCSEAIIYKFILKKFGIFK